MTNWAGIAIPIHRYLEALHTAFYTGLRRGELLALRWRDVDLNMATLSVSRSVYRAKGGQSLYQDTKTAKGRRLIDLPPESVLVLRTPRERQEADGALLGYQIAGNSPAFRYRNGSPILPRGFSGAFTKIMRRAGLEGYRLHDSRHAHATLMLRQRVHPKIVQERLGHAKVETTLNIYSHVTPGLQEAAALRFEEGLTGPRRRSPPQHFFGMNWYKNWYSTGKEKAPGKPWGLTLYLKVGAEDGIRTHDPLLGKEMLYR